MENNYRKNRSFYAMHTTPCSWMNVGKAVNAILNLFCSRGNTSFFHSCNAMILLTIVSLFFFILQVHGSGLFELRLKYFKNDFGKDNNGICCSGRTDPATNQCIGTCKTRFRVCLKHYQAQVDLTSPCTFGDFATPVAGENSMNLTDLNTIRFPFDFTWPVSLFTYDLF